MSRWFKEPLLHFLVAGGLLFAAYGWLNRGGGDEPQVVRITAAEVNWLKETWARQWQRPPSDPELRGMVADYLKEVLLAREARELGMDENDTIVRRRLAQKMEFLLQDTVRLTDPGEEELHRFYHANREHYVEPAHVSFTQIFFRDEASARQGMRELATYRTAVPGDQTLLERDYARTDKQTLASLFGHEFADTLFNLEPGKWHGPVISGYGYHLVWISERQDAHPRPFNEVRAQVLNEWYQSRQVKANEQYFAGLLKKYDIVVEDSVKQLIGPLPVITQ